MNTPVATDRIDMEVRVRYNECDPMGVAHHTAYPTWLEMARTELLRKRGTAYRDLEAEGVFFVIVRLNLNYHRPARYDDVLIVRAESAPAGRVRIAHQYSVTRAHELLAEAQTTMVCVDRDGRPQRIPDRIAG